MSGDVTRHGASPRSSIDRDLPTSLVTMSDRKRAFEGNGDSNVSKKLKRFVLPCKYLACLSLMFAGHLVNQL